MLTPDQHGATAWPLVEQIRRLTRWDFRRSIAWHSSSPHEPELGQLTEVASLDAGWRCAELMEVGILPTHL